MKITIRAIGCAAGLLLLAGCKDKDKIKKEYHKKAALGSAYVTKEAAKSTAHHGYEAACAKGKEVKKRAQYKGKKIAAKVRHTAHDAKIGLENAAHKAKVLADMTKDKIKEVAHNAQASYHKAHDKYVAQRRIERAERIHPVVVEDEKELHIVVQEKADLQV